MPGNKNRARDEGIHVPCRQARCRLIKDRRELEVRPFCPPPHSTTPCQSASTSKLFQLYSNELKKLLQSLLRVAGLLGLTFTMGSCGGSSTGGGDMRAVHSAYRRPRQLRRVQRARQDCGAGEHCYPVSQTLGGVCVETGPGQAGDACSYDPADDQCASDACEDVSERYYLPAESLGICSSG